MPTDRYTKTVLTIIAGALVAIFVQNGIKGSQAQQPPLQKVALCDPQNPIACATFQTFQGPVGGGAISTLYTLNYVPGPHH